MINGRIMIKMESENQKKSVTEIECGDISKIDFNKIAPGEIIDVVLGGFPCQGFSLAGPRQVDDSRNILYRHFVEMVRMKSPKYLLQKM